MTVQLLYYGLAVVLVLIGLAGTIVPALPGLPVMLAGLILAAWADDFRHVGTASIVVMTTLAAIGMLIDLLAGLFGAKKTGASRQALTGAFLGGLLGMFFGLPGVIFGPVLGAMLGEWLARRQFTQAGRVGIGTFLGFLAGTAAKLGCAFAMLATFALAVIL